MTRFGSPSAMTVAELGSADVLQQVCPKLSLVSVGEPTVAFLGFSKFTWLKMLKNSARNCVCTRSVILKFFKSAISVFQNPGPRKALRPVPYWPGSGIQNRLLVLLMVLQLVVESRPEASKTTGPSTPGTNLRSVEGLGP